MEEANVNDRDRPVTEQVCLLRRQQVEALGETVKEFSNELKNFRLNDLKHLVETVSSLTTWTQQHDKGQSRGLGILQLIVNLGGWLVAFVTLLVVLISKYK